MSSWLWPTTADVGMRVFGRDFANLLLEAAHGVQGYLVSDASAKKLNSHTRHTGEWTVMSEHNKHDPAFLFLAWLDEVLYRAEVHNQWFVDGAVRVVTTEEGLEARIHVEWLAASQIEREIEIKAVTTHNLVVREVREHEVIESNWVEVPAFQGPGWYADVVFDI
jgi:SHS2 domain-containing protein